MMKRLFAFFFALSLSVFGVWAQDSTPNEDGEYPQSDIVTVLNEQDAEGNYIAEWEGGCPVLRFTFTYPSLDSTKFIGLYIPEYDVYNVNIDHYYALPTGTKTVSSANNALKQYTRITFDGDTVADYPEVSYSKDKTITDARVQNVVFKLSYGDAARVYPFAGQKLTVSMRQMCEFRVVNNAGKVITKYAAADYNFIIPEDDTHVAVRGDVSTSSLNVGESSYLYVYNPAVLTVDGNFKCKNIYVRSGDEETHGYAAGIVINAGATLTADSVYFLKNEEDERVLGYLINNGEYNAGSVFFKNTKNLLDLPVNYAFHYGYTHESSASASVDGYIPNAAWQFTFPAYSSPVKTDGLSGWIDMELRVASTQGNYKTTSIGVPYLKESGITRVYTWEDFKAISDVQPFFLVNEYTTSVAIRVPGAINDDSSYDEEVADVNPNSSYDNGQVKTFIDNPYPAAIDWRSVAESADVFADFAQSVKDVTSPHLTHSLNSYYNVKTGFTTFDVPGKMYHGYIQPQMTHVQLVHRASDLKKITFKKENLTSYAMADEKYAGQKIVDYPYVRLYVDDNTDSKLQKGEGLRSVVVLYFVPQKVYDELHISTDENFNADYGVNTLWETLAESCYTSSFRAAGQIFPYVGAYEADAKYSDKATAIKMVPYPTIAEGETSAEIDLSEFIRISIDANMSTGAVKFGVLDYDLTDSEGNALNLGINVDGLYINYPGVSDNLSSSFNVDESYYDGAVTRSARKFESGKVYGDWQCKQLSLDLHVTNYTTDATVEAGAEAVAARVFSSNGAVSVNSSEFGTLSVYDLSGRLVGEKSAEGSMSIQLPKGVYVAAYNSVSSSVRNRVAVK